MKSKEQEIKGLRTLAELHIDRIKGYKKVLEDVKPEDTELKKLFTGMISLSQDFKEQLENYLEYMGGEEVNDQSSLLSKIHQTWIDIKAALSSQDNESLLASCEFGENVIIGAYEKVLEDHQEMEISLKMVLMNQLEALKGSAILIKGIKEKEEAL